jgi:alginate O-acetyltransferase complex protein AlgI
MDWRGLCAAASKTIFGTALVWMVMRQCHHPLVAGWVGMMGLVFILHFGLFHVAAVLWRSRGLNVRPVMHWPIAARSAGDFWGRRWNRPFNELSVRFALRPLARCWGWAWATLAVFLGSGLIHELVISFPARGGWGLPTGYFLVQGLAILAERRWEFRGHFWTVAVVAGPVFGLFHPPFVHRVMLPFFSAIGAVPMTSTDLIP